MDIIDDLRYRLRDMNVSAVAEESGIDKSALRKMVYEMRQPKQKTIDKLNVYFSRRHRLIEGAGETVDVPVLRKLVRDMNMRSLAKATGLHVNVFYKMMSDVTRPKVETVRTILSYIKQDNENV
jgi:DNA-binding phage protein